MPFTITLEPSGNTFEVEAGQSILAAGLAAGVCLPFSCKQGMCRSCRGKKISGDIDLGDVHPAYLSADLRAQDYIHLCQATARSDATIAIKELKGLAGVTVRKVPCRVAKIEKPAPDVTIVHLRLPLNENMMFIAGQHVEMMLPGDIRRSYSIATKPSVDGVVAIELHIRHIAGGAFTDGMLPKMKERELMKFEGPLGSFDLRDETEKPIIMLADSTGFAPIGSMLASAFERGVHKKRPIQFYWSAPTKAGLYRLDQVNEWVAAKTEFKFTPVVATPSPECAWTGRTGAAHDAALADIADVSGYEVYAAGAPAMIEAAREKFEARGLPADAFIADPFLTEADKAA